MRDSAEQHPGGFGCFWYFTGYDCSVSRWGARLAFVSVSTLPWCTPSYVLYIKKGRKTKGVILWQEHQQAPHSLWPSLFFSSSGGAWVVCLLHDRHGALPSSAQPRDVGYYLRARAAGRRGVFTVGREPLYDCSLQLLPCDLDASWDSMGLPFGRSLLCESEGRGRGRAAYLLHHWLHVGGPSSLEYNGCTRHRSLTYCPGPLEKP